jgi:hypothetical protein
VKLTIGHYIVIAAIIAIVISIQRVVLPCSIFSFTKNLLVKRC